MKDHSSDHRNDDLRNSDDDQLRDRTMNETIREVNGDADMNLNDIREDSVGLRQADRTSDIGNDDLTQGVSYTPNDASGVRSGGFTDMDDQTAGGAGLNNDTRAGAGSNITPKRGVSGSDYDGQVSTS